MSRTLRGYKVVMAVGKRLRSAIMWDDDAWCCQYRVGRWTYGKIVDGHRTPLMVFSNLDDARSFARQRGDAVVYTCDYTPHVGLWPGWVGLPTTVLSRAGHWRRVFRAYAAGKTYSGLTWEGPPGTVLASRVRLRRKRYRVDL